MAPVYLLDIFKIIDKHLAELQKVKASATHGESSNIKFLKGRLDALIEVRDFLKNGYEGKLPRRMRPKTTPLGK